MVQDACCYVVCTTDAFTKCVMPSFTLYMTNQHTQLVTGVYNADYLVFVVAD